MSRIKPLERKEAPWSVRWMYGFVKKALGKEITPLKVQARVPSLLYGSALMDFCLKRSGRVPAKLLEMVVLRAAACVGCPF